jgi:thioredoxin reductase (NADPH)
MYDVLIIGAGGTGMAAAIYTTRYDLKTLILTKDIGGQAALTEVIENYPGIESIGGYELMENFKKHAEKCGAEIVLDPATKLVQTEGGFEVHTESESVFSAKTVIVTSGLEHKKLGVPGEDKFYGKGVAYCATCDAPLYRDKTTLVIGGGNSALEGAEVLGRIGKKVYGVVRGSSYFGEAEVLRKVVQNPKVEVFYNSSVIEILGEAKVSGAVIKNKTTDEITKVEADGIFVAIGWAAKSEWLGDFVERTKTGEILVGVSGETKTPGLFAAGDITKLPTKQLVVSAGEGVKAALRAVQYIRSGK